MRRSLIAGTVLGAAALYAGGVGAFDLVEPPQTFAVDRETPVFKFDARWISPEAPSPTLFLFDDRRVLSVLGSAALTDGFEAGFRFDIEETANGQQSSGLGKSSSTLYASGGFGRFELGQTQTATDALHIQGTSAIASLRGYEIGSDHDVFWSPLLGFGRVSRRGPDVVDDEATIRYMSPQLFGLTVGVSYANDTDRLRVRDSFELRFEDIFSLAAQYTAGYGNTSATFYAGYETSNLLSRPHDIGSVGAMVQHGGMKVAAGFGFEDAESGAVRFHGFQHGYSTAWADLGVSYGRGPWAVSFGAAWEKRKSAFSTDVTDLRDYALSSSFNYDVMPGVSLVGGLTHYRLEHIDASRGFTDSAFLFATPDDAATTASLAARVKF
ncbi:MAG: porin [Alphaproteobacteria bacterium]|nr:porin [Alphaproteobacteria bacterium]